MINVLILLHDHDKLYMKKWNGKWNKGAKNVGRFFLSAARTINGKIIFLPMLVVVRSLPKTLFRLIEFISFVSIFLQDVSRDRMWWCLGSFYTFLLFVFNMISVWNLSFYNNHSYNFQYSINNGRFLLL